MKTSPIKKISLELRFAYGQVQAAARLLAEGATIPFIARYRKEATGSLDEVALAAIRDRLEELDQLDDRRAAVLRSLQERDLLSEELRDSIDRAETMAALEDLYLPYRPKRRTRASIARERGLEPLAQRLFGQDASDPVTRDPLREAEQFINLEQEIHAAEEALAGARDIIAEWINEDAGARAAMRSLFLQKARFKSQVVAGRESEGVKYMDYYDWEEPVLTTPSHRVLAVRRGEKEGVLALHVVVPERDAIHLLVPLFVKGTTPASLQVKQATEDSYRRLLFPSMETEIRMVAKARADEDAIGVFADNLRQLLLVPPLGQKAVLAIDPGFRTGCKVVCLDRQGKLLRAATIYPHRSRGEAIQAADTLVALSNECNIEAIAVGNGTAGRETEAFLNGLDQLKHIPVVSVNESGASVYSASEIAREEFPDQDITVRGAISIGRRLMDPLAELVKVDPKAIGVGQYQHDVDQSALKKSLDDVVRSCVNMVGVEANTASPQLLAYVSGLGQGLAKAIVKYRGENGPFSSRAGLRKVPRLGPKAFEQAAGFLRISGAANPLDSSAVHPESYPIVEAMARDLSVTVGDLISSKELRNKLDLTKYMTESVGLPTLRDIMSELDKPGRDPREEFEVFSFTQGVEKIEDLRLGMKLPGIVTNVTAFGAFIDIGVHQDGLVHISELADRFVRNPHDIVKVHQKVTVTVLDVQTGRKRISLSMKNK